MVATTTVASGQGLAARVEVLAPLVIGLASIIAVFAIAFFPSINWMAGEWAGSSGVLSHGYLVVAISTVLFVRAIPDVAAQGLEPSWWMLPVLLGLSGVWLLGYVATVVAVQTVVLPAILLVAIIGAFGYKASRPLVFPVLFVYFALPLWEHLQFIFQAITVSVVSVLIRLADIPALIDGHFVHLSTGSFEIAGSCGGLAFIVAGMSLAVLYGHLFYDRMRQTALLLLVMLAGAMLGNWIRVFTVIVIGYRTDMQSPLMDDHLTMGWIMFAVLMIPVFAVARRIEDHEHSQKNRAHIKAARWGSLLPAGIAVLVMIAGPAWALTVSDSDSETNGLNLNMPDGDGVWSGPGLSHWEWSPKFAGPAVERVAQYGSDEQFVLAYTNLYLSQVQDRELVYFSNRVAGEWRDVAVKGNVASTVTTEGGLDFRQVTARNYLGDWLIWYRYQIDVQFEITDARAKMTQALAALRGRPEAGVVAFATPCRESCDLAFETMSDFVDHVGHAIRVDYSQEMQ